MYCLFCVVLCIVYMYMCMVILPQGGGGYQIAVNKYIISYESNIGMRLVKLTNQASLRVNVFLLKTFCKL
jgi:hypothetical protein